MSKIGFATDLDGVIADNDGPLTARIRADHGIDFFPADMTRWSTEELLAERGIENAGPYIGSIFDDPEWVANVPLILPMLPALRKIRGICNPLHVVTARRPHLVDTTRLWLNEYLIPFDKLVHTNDKAQYLREQKINYIIEDAPHHAESCLSYGIGVFLIDKPYNQGVQSRGGLWRITDPKEIPALLLQDLKERNYV